MSTARGDSGTERHADLWRVLLKDAVRRVWVGL
jgi:hypothetical protein